MPARSEILQLYKQLLRYGRQLKLSDSDYYLYRIRAEFEKNRTLTESEQIAKQFDVSI